MSIARICMSVGMSLAFIGAVVGCGQSGGGGIASELNTTANQVPNSTANIATNPSAQNSTSSQSSMASSGSFHIQNIKVDPNVTVTIRIPGGWTKQNHSTGDTAMTTWVNLADTNQWVRLLTSGNGGALQNSSSQYDVRSYINTPGVTWTSTSSDNLTGTFTIPVGTIHNTTEGYGFAQVVTKRNPLGITVQVVAPEPTARAITGSVKVISAGS